MEFLMLLILLFIVGGLCAALGLFVGKWIADGNRDPWEDD